MMFIYKPQNFTCKLQISASRLLVWDMLANPYAIQQWVKHIQCVEQLENNNFDIISKYKLYLREGTAKMLYILEYHEQIIPTKLVLVMHDVSRSVATFKMRYILSEIEDNCTQLICECNVTFAKKKYYLIYRFIGKWLIHAMLKQMLNNMKKFCEGHID